MFVGISSMLADILGMLSSILGIASLAVMIRMAYYMKNAMSAEGLLERAEDILTDMSQNEQLLAQFYKIGGYFGAGAMAGTGIKKQGGKQSWLQMGLELAQAFGVRLPQFGQQQQQEQGSGDYGQTS